MEKSTPEYFWKRVDIRGKDDCWIWTGALVPEGYGQLGFQGKHWRAHCLAYFLTHGVLPSKPKGVLHSCDNPPCCNPKHLYGGTQKQNNADAKIHGKWSNSKLKERRIKQASRAMRLDEQIERINHLYNQHYRMREIGSILGLSESSVSRIINKNRRLTKFSNLSI